MHGRVVAGEPKVLVRVAGRRILPWVQAGTPLEWPPATEHQPRMATIAGRAALVAALFAAVTLARAADGRGEEGRPLARVWLPRDYHASPQVIQVALAPSGFVVLASAGYVVEFDGRDWRKIETPLPIIRGLGVGEDDRIWVGGPDDFGVVEHDAAGHPHFRSLVALVPEA